MTSLRINSYDNQNNTFKNKYSLIKRDSFPERPTPLDFDSFIPWFCLELQIPKNVVVIRTNQAEYVPYNTKLSKDSSTKSSKSKSRSTKMKFSSAKSNIESRKSSIASALPKISFATSTISIEDAIPVTTCYDKRGRLIEIAIVGCPFPIPRKVIQAFNLCLPFHSGLSKLSIRKGGLSETILYEISKLLPHSNITEICFDDSKLLEGNYSILLSRLSQIKYLSLKRCGINDTECKNIAAQISLKGPAVKTLLLLDLTSNNIMDEGAQALGESIKYNRHLVYLNLSGNKISDHGASYILKYLQEFKLTFDDILQKRLRRMDYLRCKSKNYEKCLEEVKLVRLDIKNKKDCKSASDQVHPIIHISKQGSHKKNKKYLPPSIIFEETTVEEEAEKKTNEIVGAFDDPFKEEYIVHKGGCLYAIGNFTLSSLNLAYNNLSLFSLRNILKVLKYQSEINSLTDAVGLVRVVIDGNNTPNNCNELYEIDICLKRAVLQMEPLSFSSFINLNCKRA